VKDESSLRSTGIERPRHLPSRRLSTDEPGLALAQGYPTTASCLSVYTCWICALDRLSACRCNSEFPPTPARRTPRHRALFPTQLGQTAWQQLITACRGSEPETRHATDDKTAELEVTRYSMAPRVIPIRRQRSVGLMLRIDNLDVTVE